MTKISIIGGGNMGGAIARGLATSERYEAENITVIDSDRARVEEFAEAGLGLNATAEYDSLLEADIVVVAVKPWNVEQLLKENLERLIKPNQLIVSVAAGLSLADIEQWTGESERALFCAIPNTAIAIKESMTFVSQLNASPEQTQTVLELFGELGKVELIEERLLSAATALCSCGIAYAFRYIRAAMEGGVELGLYPNQAKEGVVQTLKGAIALLEANDSHPEAEIDKVTTAGGVTIRGLNEMEHAGFTSAVIRGLKKSV